MAICFNKIQDIRLGLNFCYCYYFYWFVRFISFHCYYYCYYYYYYYYPHKKECWQPRYTTSILLTLVNVRFCYTAVELVVFCLPPFHNVVPVRLYLPPVKTTMSNIGETVTWSCAASGLPQPSIRWEKIGGDLPGDRYNSHPKWILHLVTSLLFAQLRISPVLKNAHLRFLPNYESWVDHWLQ